MPAQRISSRSKKAKLVKMTKGFDYFRSRFDKKAEKVAEYPVSFIRLFKPYYHRLISHHLKNRN